MLEEYGVLLNMEDLVEILKMAPSSIYDLLRTGQIKGFLTKNKWYVYKPALIDWIERQTYGEARK